MASPGLNEYTPEIVSMPGETLQEVLAEQGISQAQLAQRTGRPRKTINEIIQGKAALTPETALQLERVLGIPAAFWSSLESNYREHLARTAERRRLEEHVDWMRTLPVAAMIRQGWIARCPDKIDQLRAVLTFFGVASPERWSELVQSTELHLSTVSPVDMGALAAWLRRGEIEGRAMRCEPYDRSGFRRALQDARSLTRLPLADALGRLQERCALAGVAIVFVPELAKTRVAGATRWLSTEKALIQLSLRYEREDVLWLSFFHEAAHVLLHGKRSVFIDRGEGTGEQERQADELASNELIPRRAYRELVTRRAFSRDQLIERAAELGIHPGIIVGRLQHDGHLGLDQRTELLRPIDPDMLLAVKAS
jgi:addiction module HigA family antidote